MDRVAPFDGDGGAELLAGSEDSGSSLMHLRPRGYAFRWALGCDGRGIAVSTARETQFPEQLPVFH